MRDLRKELRLYLVTDEALCRDLGLVETVRQAVSGGVTMVQLRAKSCTSAERYQMALALKDALAGTGVALIVNDDIEAALAAGAEGLHIGQGDMTPQEARARLGPEKLLGLSCETLQTVREAPVDLVDYLGLGPVFGTPTKPDHHAPIGFDGLARLVAQTPLPSVAIGGLSSAHLAQVEASGACGLAVVSAICGQPDPKAAAQKFTQRPIKRNPI